MIIEGTLRKAIYKTLHKKLWESIQARFPIIMKMKSILIMITTATALLAMSDEEVDREILFLMLNCEDAPASKISICNKAKDAGTFSTNPNLANLVIAITNQLMINVHSLHFDNR